MSGGYFDYAQYRITDIAEEIDRFLSTQHGHADFRTFPPDILERFRQTAYELRRAGEMAQRVDWLLSFDDGEESFRSRWQEEVRPPWPPPSPPSDSPPAT